MTNFKDTLASFSTEKQLQNHRKPIRAEHPIVFLLLRFIFFHNFQLSLMDVHISILSKRILKLKLLIPKTLIINFMLKKVKIILKVNIE